MGSSALPPRTPSAADAWWGSDEAAAPAAPVRGAGSGTARGPRGVGRRRSSALRLLLRPLVLFGSRVRRSPRLRRVGARGLVVLLVASVVAGAVGVILLNNTVISRTAELGKLEDRRRELRRENALLGAQAAKLSARAEGNARTKLGMAQSSAMPRFIFLEPGSRALTQAQRTLVAQRARARRDAAAARAAAATHPTPAPRAGPTTPEATP